MIATPASLAASSESREVLAGVTPRWTRLDRDSAQQRRYFWDGSRVICVACGRRSGKTEIGKRKLVAAAIARDMVLGRGRFIFSAPTHDQAWDIHWEDLRSLVPIELQREIHLGRRELVLPRGTLLQVRGLDKPQRIEGSPVHGILVSEYGDVKRHTWDKHIRPAISTRGQEGFAILDGVPRGGTRGHWAQTWQRASSGEMEDGDASAYAWPSSEVLAPEEIAKARGSMDPTLFEQEYEARFTSFGSAAYSSFRRELHAYPGLRYEAGRPLIFCFDFNVEPGVAVVVQEQTKRLHDGSLRYLGATDQLADSFTAVIGQVHIPKNSRTAAVCDRLKADWRDRHRGEVWLYGDISGGARHTSQTDRSTDWDIILRSLGEVLTWQVRDRRHRIGSTNPAERSRVNAMNARLQTADGAVRMLICSKAAPHVLDCVEGTRLLEGGSGEIDKDATPEFTHASDALGYYEVAEHPIASRGLAKRVI